MRGKITSFILSILLILTAISTGVIINADEVEASTSHTRSDAVAWVNARVAEGWAQDVDGKNGCQCVDLIMAYYDYLGVSRVGGNAIDYAYSQLPSGWSKVPSAQPGDIVVWGPGGVVSDGGHVADSANGHIGIVLEGISSSKIRTAETNTLEGGAPAHSFIRNAYTVNCYIRPDWSGTVSFDPQGGIGFSSPKTVMINSSTWSCLEGIPQKTCVVFAGWYDSDGNPIYDSAGRAVAGKYWKQVGSDPADSLWIYGGNVTAYAKWGEPVHSWDAGTIAKPATYFSVGVKTYVCTACGATKSQSIPSLNAAKVTPAKVKLTSAKVSGRKLTVKWKRISANTKGYQVALKDKKTGKQKYITVKQSKNKTLSKTIKKLKKKKTYAVRVRAYNVIGTETIYGPWSNVKIGKVK